jgi:hypothetical protein
MDSAQIFATNLLSALRDTSYAQVSLSLQSAVYIRKEHTFSAVDSPISTNIAGFLGACHSGLVLRALWRIGDYSSKWVSRKP